MLFLIVLNFEATCSPADQSCIPEEVVVADDGSDCETRSIIDEARSIYPFKIIHSWQPDKGFRLSRSRNLGFLRSTGSLILFVDGDCILPPNFIKNQCRLTERNALIFSGKLATRGVTESSADLNVIMFANIFRGIKFMTLPLGSLGISTTRLAKLAGFPCRYNAIYFVRLAVLMSYCSWGFEDSDLGVRAERAGGYFKDGRFSAAVFHLFHAEPNARKI